MPAYPGAPWRMHGQAWCSLFRVPRSPERPAGTYGVALLRYAEPSPLTYAELLVAHAVSSPGASRIARTTWSVSVDRAPALAASFADVSRYAPRTPFRGATWQPGIPERGETTARFTGSSRTLPCRAHWSFDPVGPLAWLRGGRQLASFQMTDFEMEFA